MGSHTQWMNWQNKIDGLSIIVEALVENLDNHEWLALATVALQAFLGDIQKPAIKLNTYIPHTYFFKFIFYNLLIYL
jgi:hypothetical protein